ncbi:MAG: hypothetical protein EOO40_05395 [Deltaproteobacteria bacterium]|nr:MAG: hypothetical protein EOO40_05395 [Deltaproteobacteria bacterium]
MAYVLPDNNTFDPTRVNLAPETLSLDELLQRTQRNLALGLRVAMPCAITAIHGDQLVDLQPLLMTRFAGAAPQPMAQLHRVPVIMPKGAGYSIRYPISLGDTGLAVFADRNLDTYLASSGQVLVDPNDDRAHDLSDATFVPGLGADAQQTSGTGPNLVLQCQSLTATLGPTGTFAVRNAQAELVTAVANLATSVNSLLSTLAATTVPTSNGPVPLSTAPQFASAASSVAQIVALLQSFEGG